MAGGGGGGVCKRKVLASSWGRSTRNVHARMSSSSKRRLDDSYDDQSNINNVVNSSEKDAVDHDSDEHEQAHAMQSSAARAKQQWPRLKRQRPRDAGYFVDTCADGYGAVLEESDADADAESSAIDSTAESSSSR